MRCCGANKRSLGLTVETHGDWAQRFPMRLQRAINGQRLAAIVGTTRLWTVDLMDLVAQGQADATRVQGPGSKANAQGQADATSVQGPGSEANAQGQADAARVQGPVSESNASGQADAQGSQASSAADPASWSSSVQRSNGPSAYKWETDTHEWVQRDCWACTDCRSMNLRFTQCCKGGKQRKYQQE